MGLMGGFVERDSPQAHFLVILFIVLTGGLLGGAALKQYGVDVQALWSRNGIRGVILVSLSLRVSYQGDDNVLACRGRMR
jgi:hypothetical protein